MKKFCTQRTYENGNNVYELRSKDIKSVRNKYAQKQYQNVLYIQQQSVRFS